MQEPKASELMAVSNRPTNEEGGREVEGEGMGVS